ncbi:MULTISPECIES: DUF488 domain-containing protein [Nocardia]|uniref:DUF488 domain-containing protein n=1 Tax=Nocardia TaxID=1817 RepID=UPI001892FFE3|nr:MULTISPECIES: DUF488 family protein [Nocardia]MBF6351856.1 DUF488 family protein [Nocardia flavorosea]
MSGQITYCRVYDPISPAGNARILVDRVWPRGLRKDDLDLTEWLRDIAPSTELRHWYNHKPARFAEFRRRYLAELTTPPHRTAADHLRRIAADTDVTLLTASRDIDHSQAAVLVDWLTESRSRPH